MYLLVSKTKFFYGKTHIFFVFLNQFNLFNQKIIQYQFCQNWQLHGKSDLKNENTQQVSLTC